MRDLSRAYTGERQSSELRGANDVLANHIYFEVHAIVELGTGQVRMRHRVRHNLHVKPIDAQSRHRQADAVHGDGALLHEKRREVRRKADREPVKIRVASKVLDHTDRVDVALYEMASEPAVRPQRTFEVHGAA